MELPGGAFLLINDQMYALLSIKTCLQFSFSIGRWTFDSYCRSLVYTLRTGISILIFMQQLADWKKD